MSQPPRTSEKIAWSAIDQWICLRQGYAFHDPTDEDAGDPEFFEDRLKELMIDSIKCVGHVQFDNHPLFLSIDTAVNCLLNEDHIVRDVSFGNEASLVLRDEGRKELFNPVS